jgi:hypothetical protein
MSDTPGTDNLARGNHVVPTEFAQDLERERDEAKKELADLNKRFIDKCVKEARLQMQLDERWALRRELEAELGITDEMASDDSLMVGLEAIKALKRERDQWREVADLLVVALKELGGGDLPDYAEFVLSSYHKLREATK